MDYCPINSITIRYHHTILRLDDLLDELHGTCIISKIDLRSSINVLRIHRQFSEVGGNDSSINVLRIHHQFFEVGRNDNSINVLEERALTPFLPLSSRPERGTPYPVDDILLPPLVSGRLLHSIVLVLHISLASWLQHATGTT
ncbi:hypothetical protein CR513_14703, partial [Mucuna pruriens]